jgi:hypothetical protein
MITFKSLAVKEPHELPTKVKPMERKVRRNFVVMEGVLNEMEGV